MTTFFPSCEERDKWKDEAGLVELRKTDTFGSSGMHLFVVIECKMQDSEAKAKLTEWRLRRNVWD